MHAPTTLHYAALLRVLRYLCSTITRSLFYNSDLSLNLRAFSDAGWTDDPDTRRSTTGYCIFLGNSLISWRSKRQEVVSRSSTEAEYRDMADTTLEIHWICEFLSDIGISIKTPIPMHCENKSAIAIASNPVFHNRTKHIDVDCHITRQAYENKIISLPYTPSSSQLADFFTKAQTSLQFRLLLSKLSVYDPP